MKPSRATGFPVLVLKPAVNLPVAWERCSLRHETAESMQKRQIVKNRRECVRREQGKKLSLNGIRTIALHVSLYVVVADLVRVSRFFLWVSNPVLTADCSMARPRQLTGVRHHETCAQNKTG